MESYATMVGEFENKVSKDTHQFKNRLEDTERECGRDASIELAKTAITSLMESRRGCNNIPREPWDPPTWWEVFVKERYPQSKCEEFFKCSRKTYVFLVKNLRPHIRVRLKSNKLDPDTTRYTSAEKQVAIMLHKLGRCTDYDVMWTMFRIHRTTIQKIIYEVLNAINKHLLRTMVKMPKQAEARKITQQLENITMIPQLLGTLEMTHIPIYLHGRPEFVNSKNYASIVMQTVADARSCFRDVSVRHIGSTEERHVLEDSNIYKYYERVIPRDTQQIRNHKVPYKIVASSAYPLLPWLLTEYEPAVTSGEKSFNEHLRIARWSSSEAIIRLKARFAILSRSIDMNYRIAPQLIAACCAIHNVCEQNADTMRKEWLAEAKVQDLIYPQPERVPDTRVPNPSEVLLRNTMRDHLEARLAFELLSSNGVTVEKIKGN